MSKLALCLTIPALAALVAWNLSLSSDLDELRARLDTARAEPAEKAAPAAETKVRDTSRAAQQQIAELAQRVAEIEKARTELASAPAAASGSPGTLPGDAAGADAPASGSVEVTDGFRSAVAKVLDERDAARRKERMQRAAEARARFLLRDLQVTDAQRREVESRVLASMEKIEQIRENEELPDEQRRQDVQAVQQETIDGLAAVLDAQSMESVRRRSTGGQTFRRGGNGDAGGGNGGGGRRNGGNANGNGGGNGSGSGN